MIKNVIFDIGNVLAKFRWKELFLELGFDSETFEAVADATVRSKDWLEYDRSLLDEETLISNCVKSNPKYEKEIRSYFEHIGEICVTYPYAENWIKDLQKKGFKVYLLSNFGEKAFQLHVPEMPFLNTVDGKVISYEVHYVKPEKEIFEKLQEKYQIRPSESVFLDDVAVNVEAAKRYGYHGIVFKTKEQAEEELEKLFLQLN